MFPVEYTGGIPPLTKNVKFLYYLMTFDNIYIYYHSIHLGH